MGGLAIIAGEGGLPGVLRAARPDALTVLFRGVAAAAPEGPRLAAQFEKIGTLFTDLRAAGVETVVFAGAIGRPALNPGEFDAKLMSLAPRIVPALAGGDDALLRTVIAIFEDEGFRVAGAHEVAPDTLAGAGQLAGPAPSKTDLTDAARATEILAALAPVDVAQGVVVAGGLCLGIETLQGTDALLRFVGETPEQLRRGARGVLVKQPKAGQDLRVDMPAIGPATVDNAAEAGLAGIVVAEGATLVLDRAALVAQAEARGVFVIGQ